MKPYAKTGGEILQTQFATLSTTTLPLNLNAYTAPIYEFLHNYCLKYALGEMCQRRPGTPHI